VSASRIPLCALAVNIAFLFFQWFGCKFIKQELCGLAAIDLVDEAAAKLKMEMT
jgi:hypothetical protein